MNRFFVVEGPLRGKTFPVTELASIGRDASCAVRIEGHHISRIHAQVEKRGEATVIRDNKSRNGIFVNGQKVGEAVLRSDDEVEIGEHVLVFNPSGDPWTRPNATAKMIESLTEPFAPAEGDERLPKIIAIAASLAAMDDEREIARGLLAAIMAEIAAERGVVMLADATGQLKPAARKSSAGDEEFTLSSVLSNQVHRERRAVIATDIRRVEPRSGKPYGILAAPIAAKGFMSGIVCLDAKMEEAASPPPFKPADLRLAATLGSFAGVRIAQLRRLPPRAKLGEKPLAALTAAFEKECLAEALRLSKGDLGDVAKLLGLDRAKLDAKLKALGLVAAAPPAKPVQDATWKSVQS